MGFGSIQQRISERSRDEKLQYDASANINLDKLLPSKSGIKLPLYISSSTSIITPKYDPLDKDIPLTASIKSFDTREQQDEYKRLTEERIESKSISLNNIRKERMNPDSRVDFWDIENFSTGFSYSERSSSNITTHSMESKEHRGNITYNFSPKKINITPFSNLKFFENKIFKLIKDFNLNLLPSNINIRGDLNRRFNKTQYRNSDLKIDNVDPIYEKYFSLNKSYGIRWDLTNSLNPI